MSIINESIMTELLSSSNLLLYGSTVLFGIALRWFRVYSHMEFLGISVDRDWRLTAIASLTYGILTALPAYVPPHLKPPIFTLSAICLAIGEVIGQRLYDFITRKRP